MTDNPRLSTRRRWAQLTLAAAVLLYGVIGFPGVPGTSTNYAVAQGCDAQCWAVLSYLADQGLTQEDVVALGQLWFGTGPGHACHRPRRQRRLRHS